MAESRQRRGKCSTQTQPSAAAQWRGETFRRDRPTDVAGERRANIIFPTAVLEIAGLSGMASPSHLINETGDTQICAMDICIHETLVKTVGLQNTIGLVLITAA